METELEAKFLNVNHQQIRSKLKALGARCQHPMRQMRRNNFDYPDKRLEKVSGWIRVRDEGDKVTLSYKQLNDRSLHGTKEVNLVVDDYQRTYDFLTAIGLCDYNYQETKRESWTLGGVQIELDEWPWVRPFVELEALDEAELKSVAQKLGLDWNKAVHGSVEVAYRSEYDVTDAEIDNWPEIKFIPIPDWLEKRRKG